MAAHSLEDAARSVKAAFNGLAARETTPGILLLSFVLLSSDRVTVNLRSFEGKEANF
jgi:hypothetical protein